jgi:hypothetical protein
MKVAIQILELALSLLRSQSGGAVQSDAALAQTLTDIVRVAARFYEDQLGRPMDPSLIKSETAM